MNGRTTIQPKYCLMDEVILRNEYAAFDSLLPADLYLDHVIDKDQIIVVEMRDGYA